MIGWISIRRNKKITLSSLVGWIFAVLLLLSQTLVVVEGIIQQLPRHVIASNEIYSLTAGEIDTTPGEIDLSSLRLTFSATSSLSKKEFLAVYRCSEDSGFGCPLNDFHLDCHDEDIQSKIEKISLRHEVFVIPPEGLPLLDDGKSFLKFSITEESGKYGVLIAHCDDRNFIQTGGSVGFKSARGYLPGNLFGHFHYVIGMTVIYLVVLGSLGFSIGQDYRRGGITIQPYQKGIFGVVLISTMYYVFMMIFYSVWNITGTKISNLLHIGTAVMYIGRGLLHCLMVMLAKGWGIVLTNNNNEVGNLWKIYILGIIYIAFTSIGSFLGFSVYYLGLIYFGTRHVIEILFWIWSHISSHHLVKKTWDESSSSSKIIFRFRVYYVVLIYAFTFYIFAFIVITDSITSWERHGYFFTANANKKFSVETQQIIYSAIEVNYTFVLIAITGLFFWNNNNSTHTADNVGSNCSSSSRPTYELAPIREDAEDDEYWTYEANTTRI